MICTKCKNNTLVREYESGIIQDHCYFCGNLKIKTTPETLKSRLELINKEKPKIHLNSEHEDLIIKLSKEDPYKGANKLLPELLEKGIVTNIATIQKVLNKNGMSNIKNRKKLVKQLDDCEVM